VYSQKERGIVTIFSGAIHNQKHEGYKIINKYFYTKESNIKLMSGVPS